MYTINIFSKKKKGNTPITSSTNHFYNFNHLHNFELIKGRIVTKF